jgi:CRP-like cAMP-binding protein
MTAETPTFGAEHYPAGSIIISQGEIPDKFYLISQGEVTIIRRLVDGREVILNPLADGDYFGEIGLLTNSRRVATVQATTDVDVMAMDRQTFRRWLNSSLLSREEISDAVEARLSDIDELLPAGAEPAASPPDLPSGALSSDNLPLTEPAAVPTPVQQQATSSLAHFAPGEVVIRQGEMADRFYIIVEGELEVVRAGFAGGENVVSHLAAGDYFGEIGLMEGGARLATVQAVTPVKLAVFDRAAFRQWLVEAPFALDELTEVMKRRLARDESDSPADDSDS